MKKITFLFLFFSLTLMGQNKKITGIVTDQENLAIPEATIIVKETNQGTTTNFDGFFSLEVQQFPVTIEVSFIGYQSVQIKVEAPKEIKIQLLENNQFLDDVIVTASRGKEKIKESPVSIERLSLKEIKRTSAASFYDGLANLKGVDINTNSLTFQAINTRGFATFANNRFLQLIDNMDNSSPALNFPLGNLVGMNELDVLSVEILPGAASALYGANAFNGVLNMRSKSPFTHKGLSAYVKYGQTNQSVAGSNPYTDVGVRYAWGGDYAAAKINFSYMEGTDWFAVDKTDIDTNNINQSVKGSRESNPSYDGMNVYGDEIATTIDLNNAFTGTPFASLNRNEVIRVSRTGYDERDLTDYKAKSIKGDIGFYYRPSGQPGKLEFIWNSRFGSGNTIYQGSNRYALTNLFIHQHKLEIKNKNFYLRTYYTGEDAGNSYDTKFTAWNINRKWRSDKDWFTDYALSYSAARANGLGVNDAHTFARNFADNENSYALFGYPSITKPTRYLPGTPEFEQAYNEVITDPDFKTGSKFIDKTNLKHFEAGYNFKDLIDFAELQVGVSTRRYSLNSNGTIFTDYPGLDPINIDEVGGYMQLSKKLMDDKLKLAASLRFDKQENLDGKFSPRFSAVYAAGEQKQHYFRVSYQTGFRNPSTQDLYIGLNLGPITLLGAAADNPGRYEEDLLSSTVGATIIGNDAYNNAYTLSSFIAFGAAVAGGTPLPVAAGLLEIADVKPIVPEQVSTIEFGYRGEIIKNLSVDFSTYYNKYNNFGAVTRVMALASEVGSVHDGSAINAIGTQSYKPFQLYTNTDVEITSYGLDVGFNYKMGDYLLGFIYDYAGFEFDQAKDPDFRPGFNMPEHRVKVSLANDKIWGDLGFKIDYKYQTEFEWQATFADGLVPARSILDAQISYQLKKYKSKIKIGGSNLTGQEYLPAPGTGKVGSIYYISFTYGQ